jgi:hypothetical protein
MLGDFIFRTVDGAEVARATDLNSLEELLHTVPAESIGYHSQRNHFSHWLMARTEFALSQKLRSRKVTHFPSIEDLWQNLIDEIGESAISSPRCSSPAAPIFCALVPAR